MRIPDIAQTIELPTTKRQATTLVNDIFSFNSLEITNGAVFDRIFTY